VHFLHKFCLRRILVTKKPCLRRITFYTKILSVGHLISVACLVYQFVGIEIRIQWDSDHNDTICNNQEWRKCQITNPLLQPNSWDTNRTTLIQFRNGLYETTYVITCNIHITRLRANTSRRIKQSSGWPLSLQPQTILYGDRRVHMHPVVRMRRIIFAIVYSKSREF